MKVGMLSASVSRQAGGFFSSVRFLSAGIVREGCDVSVFSVADEFATQDAAEWVGVGLQLHQRKGPASFGYAPALAASLEKAELDILHANGLWMYPSIAASAWAAREGRPLVISPRGMLDPWALANSRWKKRVAWALFEHANLTRAACLHALNDEEYEAIRACGLKNPVAVIPNGIDRPEPDAGRSRPEWVANLDGERALLFLGRLHQKKGLAALLSAWARLRQKAIAGAEGWRLVIAGWDQRGHEAELQRLAAKLGLGKSVCFVGPQFGAEKASSLAFADGFVLPSQSEGLPMAVLEAWAYSLPVLMTARCNLPEGFTSGAAIEITPNVDCMAERLAAFVTLSDAERRAMGERGRRLVEARFAWEDISREMIAVYRWLIDGAETPVCLRVA